MGPGRSDQQGELCQEYLETPVEHVSAEKQATYEFGLARTRDEPVSLSGNGLTVRAREMQSGHWIRWLFSAEELPALL